MWHQGNIGLVSLLHLGYVNISKVISQPCRRYALYWVRSSICITVDILTVTIAYYTRHNWDVAIILTTVIVHHYQRHPVATAAAAKNEWTQWHDVDHTTMKATRGRSVIWSMYHVTSDVTINRWRHAAYRPASVNYDH